MLFMDPCTAFFRSFLLLLHCLVINFILNMIRSLFFFFKCCCWYVARCYLLPSKNECHLSPCRPHRFTYTSEWTNMFFFVFLLLSFVSISHFPLYRYFVSRISLIQWHFNTFRSFDMLLHQCWERQRKKVKKGKLQSD